MAGLVDVAQPRKANRLVFYLLPCTSVTRMPLQWGEQRAVGQAWPVVLTKLIWSRLMLKTKQEEMQTMTGCPSLFSIAVVTKINLRRNYLFGLPVTVIVLRSQGKTQLSFPLF